MTHYILIVLVCVCISLGQVMMRRYAMHLDFSDSVGGLIRYTLMAPSFWYFSFLYFIAITMWLWLMSKHELTQIYPLVSLSFILTPAFSYFMLDESIDLRYALGTVLICGGVALITLGNRP